MYQQHMLWLKNKRKKINYEFLSGGLHRLEKYLNIHDCLEKSLKITFALKST